MLREVVPNVRCVKWYHKSVGGLGQQEKKKKKKTTPEDKVLVPSATCVAMNVCAGILVGSKDTCPTEGGARLPQGGRVAPPFVVYVNDHHLLSVVKNMNASLRISMWS